MEVVLALLPDQLESEITKVRKVRKVRKVTKATKATKVTKVTKVTVSRTDMGNSSVLVIPIPLIRRTREIMDWRNQENPKIQGKSRS